MSRLWLVLLASGIFAPCGRTQDSAAASGLAKSFVGSARVSFDATYFRQIGSLLEVNGSYTPFVSDQWQMGIAPFLEVVNDRGDTFFAGVAGVTVNYLPLTGHSSRPYVGAFLSEGGASRSTASAAYGVQGGWLQFLSPSVAMRGELRYRRFSPGLGADEQTELLFSVDPYLFGRASQRLTALPTFGVFDASGFADFQIAPTRSLSFDVAMAPFLTRYLQTGLAADLFFAFNNNTGAHQIEWFGRGYLPVDRRVLPFADSFLAERYSSGDENEGSHGARVGVRSYLTAGVALDVALEWRNYTRATVDPIPFRRLEERRIRAMLTTQFRATRGRD